MSKQIALLEYTFMFNPANTWQHGSEFEKDLSDFFTAHGFDAQFVETRGGSPRRIFYISKIEEMPKLENTPERPVQEVVNNLRGQPIINNSFKKPSVKPILKGVMPTKKGPKAKLKNYYETKFHPNKEYKR